VARQTNVCQENALRKTHNQLKKLFLNLKNFYKENTIFI